MPKLKIKSTHKVIKHYYAALEDFDRLGVSHESAVRSAFQSLLQSCARQVDWTLVPEYSIAIRRNKKVVVDAALLDDFRLPHGYWEAKDIHDDLEAEVERKFEQGYPNDNILFQTPQRAILYQDDRPVLDADLKEPKQLIETLESFFSYRTRAYEEWQEAVAKFKDIVPKIGKGLAEIIAKERETNSRFIKAFTDFHSKCRQAINPDLSEAAVEEMLIQHLLTVRVFRTVFDNPDFTRRNVIANEIETVIDALTSQSFSREEFLRKLDRFYIAIEETARSISDFSQKQDFLNTVYEQFFQGFSVQVADTHGIVYTPQPIVEFMVQSVEHILQKQFARSLSATNVHIIDPFVGTGNFIVRIMRQIHKTALEQKYSEELHCNEIMLLPYYIASMNIEHEFYQATENYQAFSGICLVDTFELAEDRQLPLDFMEKNTRRVKEQKDQEMFVIIGNPPYNVGQANENDNNKNRKYKTMDKRVKDTYSKDSAATNKNKLLDPYVKAIRWASDRIGKEGIVAFVSNNSFIDSVAFDGMRKHLAQDFDAIYLLDLGGNLRRGLKISDANVFGIRVGVSINLFVKSKQNPSERARIFYYRSDELWNKDQKFDFLDERRDIGGIEWQAIQADPRHTWLTEGLQAEFETFIPMGTKAAKAAKARALAVIFKTYSLGVTTNRDAWAYNFDRKALSENMRGMIESYNAEVDRYKRREDRHANIDDFVLADDQKISWSETLKRNLQRGKITDFSQENIRVSLYRPFTKSSLYFDRMMNERVREFPSIFPTVETETENRVICVNVTQERPFTCLMVNCIPELVVTGGFGSPTQCFPFYSYDEDGSKRRENISAWALTEFRKHYGDDGIGKWDIFYYTYGILHHPAYRRKYALNLKRDLPHIPFAPDFHSFAYAGRCLAELHLGYETVAEYPLHFIETPGKTLDWRVEKMKFSKDKTAIVVNDFLSLDGIPSTAFDYRLGTRSALEWVIDQYRVKTDKRSGISNDPNRPDEPKTIVGLIGKVITVSLDTVKIVTRLPELKSG